MELPDLRKEPLKHICIIGAGASGLAALKVITESIQYRSGEWSVIAFEARDSVGGVWCPALPVDDPPLTPLYDSLTTNLPHPVMAYSSFSFPPSTPLFPKAAIVQQYLEDYASHFNLLPHIKLRTTVLSVTRDTDKWKVATSESPIPQYYDLIIVANGHYRKPLIPDVPGLAQWVESKKAMHSVWYRRPYDLGRKILVLGGGPSGNDISAEMLSVSEVVIQSIPGTIPSQEGKLRRLGRAIEFHETGDVKFEDGSIENHIDFCILATGYEFSYPFLNAPEIINAWPPSVPPLPPTLYNSTRCLFPLAKHIFPLQNLYPVASMAFMGLPKKVAPLPLVEAQALAIVHALANPSALDTTNEAIDIISRYEELGGNVTTWHKFGDLEQYDHRDALFSFVGVDTRTPGWEREYYCKKDILRRTWVKLEKDGKADEWVNGVGSGGNDEWVDLMRRLVDFAESQEAVSRL